MQTLSVPWRKSTYSTNGGQDCIEAASVPGAVLIRDTKNNGHGPVLRLSFTAFAEFTTRVRKDAVL